jgi:hypothetical protein
MLKPGKYLAKVVDAGMSQTQKGAPQAFMKFEINETGETNYLTWFGGTSEKAIEFTAQALVHAGFIGNDLPDLEKKFSDVFQPRQVRITVEQEDYNGKTMTKIKWVNPVNQGPDKYHGQIPKFAALFAKTKAEAGVKPQTSGDGW